MASTISGGYTTVA